MANCLIKRTIQELKGRRQYHQVTSCSQVARGVEYFLPVVGYVFNYINIKNAIKFICWLQVVDRSIYYLAVGR